MRIRTPYGSVKREVDCEPIDDAVVDEPIEPIFKHTADVLFFGVIGFAGLTTVLKLVYGLIDLIAYFLGY